MIWAQILLTTVVVFLIVYLLRNRTKSHAKAYKKLLLIAFLFASILTIIFPNSLTEIAQLFGIGRGADLLLYGVTLVVIFQLVNSYIKDREEQTEIYKIARKVAVLDANQRYSKKTKTN